MTTLLPCALTALSIGSLYLLNTSLLTPWIGSPFTSSSYIADPSPSSVDPPSTLSFVIFCVSCALQLMAWASYERARFSSPGRVPTEMAEHARNSMPPEMRSGPHWCDKCENVKPPRARHCKRCKTCTLRMDHHCVALNNCIGLYNYKYFLCTWFYCLLASVVMLTLVLARIVFDQQTFDPWSSSGKGVLFLGFLSTCMSLISARHLNTHVNLALLGLTYIDYMALPAHISLNYFIRRQQKFTRISNWDKGWRHNLVSILGEPAICWFIPWIKPRSPWGPFPVTNYSGYRTSDVFAPPPSSKGPRVTAHNHNVDPGTRRLRAWNMFDDPVQYSRDGLKMQRGKMSLPLVQNEQFIQQHSHSNGYANGHGHSHEHGEDAHGRSHDHHGHNHAHSHEHDHGHGDHAHSHAGHDHSHAHGHGHNHHYHDVDDDDMPALI